MRFSPSVAALHLTDAGLMLIVRENYEWEIPDHEIAGAHRTCRHGAGLGGFGSRPHAGRRLDETVQRIALGRAGLRVCRTSCRRSRAGLRRLNRSSGPLRSPSSPSTTSGPSPSAPGASTSYPADSAPASPRPRTASAGRCSTRSSRMAGSSAGAGAWNGALSASIGNSPMHRAASRPVPDRQAGRAGFRRASLRSVPYFSTLLFDEGLTCPHADTRGNTACRESMALISA